MDIQLTMSPRCDDLAAKLGEDIAGAKEAGLQNVVSTIEAHAVEEESGHAKTSNLVNSITSFISGGTGIIKATASYAKYVHDGTGRYGPYNKDIVSKEWITIRPKNAKALFFPGASHPVMSVTITKPFRTPWGPRTRIKGFKGRPFFDHAIAKTNPQAAFDEGIDNFLRMRGW